jgi:hypothetical protein
MAKDPSEMLVEFGFFKGDTLLHQDAFLVTTRKGISVYGEHKHFVLPDGATEVQLFSGLVIEHQFELPSCALNVRFLEVVPGSSPLQPFEQRQRFSSALRMPVHTSEDWDSIELNEHLLAFKCRPLPR